MSTFYNDDLRMRPTGSHEGSSSSSSSTSFVSASNKSEFPPTPPPSAPASSANLMDNTNPAAQQQEQPATHTVGATDDPSNDEVSTAISWPIILAVVPTLGAFFAGSAEVWSDFVLSLLTLYYVYKWMTVPWSYFEGARARRIIHQNATSHRTTASPLSLDPKRIQLGQELRHEERVGLFWVLLSPFIVAYSLRFTRYFLTNHERYMGYFNLFIFVLAAMIKPSEYALSLLCDRTQELQTCLGPDERITDVLHSRVDRMHKEMNDFYGELITKKDVNEIATELDPAVKKLAKAAKRVERKEAKFKEWSEERFSAIDGKVNGLDQVILYRIEQDQLQSSQRTLVALMFLPVNIALWAAKGMIGWLPIQVPTLSSSALPSPTLSASIATRGEEEEDDAISLPPPPPPPQPTRAFNRAYSHRERGPALF